MHEQVVPARGPYSAWRSRLQTEVRLFFKRESFDPELSTNRFCQYFLAHAALPCRCMVLPWLERQLIGCGG
jgi:hypothetical protein